MYLPRRYVLQDRWGGDSDSSTSSGISSGGNYGGYTTGSSGNATNATDAKAAQEAYSSGKSSDGSSLAAQIAASKAAEEAARIEAERKEAERKEAERKEAERKAAEAAANKALVANLAGFAKPQAAAPQAIDAAEAEAEADEGDSVISRIMGKPGEDAQARAGALLGISVPDLAKQAKETGVPLSSLLGEPNRAQLERLRDLGYGKMEGVNPNNLTGQNVENMIAADNTGKVINKAGQLAINAALNAVPGGAFIRAGLKAANAYANDVSPADIAKNAAWDLAGGWAAGQINKEFFKGIGRDGRELLRDYGTIGSLASMAGYDLPNVGNPGGMLVGAARKAYGPGSTTSTETGMRLPDGTPVESFRSSGGGGQSATPVVPVVTPPQVTPPAPSNSGLNMRFNLNGAAMGRAIREGAMAKQRQHKGF